jgi:hypothetical protein
MMLGLLAEVLLYYILKTFEYQLRYFRQSVGWQWETKIFIYYIYMRGPLFEEREHTIYDRTHGRATFRQSPSFPTSNTALKASDL